MWSGLIRPPRRCIIAPFCALPDGRQCYWTWLLQYFHFSLGKDIKFQLQDRAVSSGWRCPGKGEAVMGGRLGTSLERVRLANRTWVFFFLLTPREEKFPSPRFLRKAKVSVLGSRKTLLEPKPRWWFVKLSCSFWCRELTSVTSFTGRKHEAFMISLRHMTNRCSWAIVRFCCSRGYEQPCWMCGRR